MPHCFGYVSRFIRVNLSGLAFTNRTKAAMPGADVAT
jgi:hypothetical protein